MEALDGSHTKHDGEHTPAGNFRAHIRLLYMSSPMKMAHAVDVLIRVKTRVGNTEAGHSRWVADRPHGCALVWLHCSHAQSQDCRC